MNATVYTDGASVYEGPDFDSRVITYLNFKTKVKASKKAYRGVGGMGLFHMIRYGGGKQGYVPDTDIRVSGGGAGETVRGEDKPKKSMSKAWEAEEKEAKGEQPLYFTRYLGGAFAMVNFTEKFSGKKYSDQMMMYGLRMTGPGTLFDGPPLDFNLWFSHEQPAYYEKFADKKTTGFLLFGDVMAMLPLIDMGSTIFNYGLGVMWTYTRYRVPVGGYSFDSQEFRVGAAVGAGLGQRLGPML
ncbi:MAG TPA: hypothetical protein PKC28_16380, partial [Bdellovibrionales bacterium]|nr:hypothetical protein [Bdellovibrionales bacterium]